jgi:hypothetical protein
VRADAGPIEPGFVLSVGFAPDDRTVVIGGSAGAASFWSVPDLTREGQRIPIGNGANNGGTYAWYGPNGDVVGLAQDQRASNSGLLRWFRFKASPSELAKTACELAGADITRAQWRRYLGGRPYRQICPPGR